MVSVCNGPLLCSTHKDSIVAMRGLCVDMAELLPTLASPYNSSNTLGRVYSMLYFLLYPRLKLHIYDLLWHFSCICTVYICIYPCSKGTHVYVYIYYVFMHKRRIYKWQMLRCFVFWLYCVLWSKFVTITGNVSFCQHSSWICEMLAILCCVSISISHNHIAKFVEFHLTLMGEHTKCSGDNCGRGCGLVGI